MTPENQPPNWPDDGDTVLKTTRAHVANIPLEVRRKIVETMRREHPDIWQLSEEVDFTLVEYMLAMTPAERVAVTYQVGRSIEVMRGASKVSQV